MDFVESVCSELLRPLWGFGAISNATTERLNEREIAAESLTESETHTCGPIRGKPLAGGRLFPICTRARRLLYVKVDGPKRLHE